MPLPSPSSLTSDSSPAPADSACNVHLRSVQVSPISAAIILVQATMTSHLYSSRFFFLTTCISYLLPHNKLLQGQQLKITCASAGQISGAALLGALGFQIEVRVLARATVISRQLGANPFPSSLTWFWSQGLYGYWPETSVLCHMDSSTGQLATCQLAPFRASEQESEGRSPRQNSVSL